MPLILNEKNMFGTILREKKRGKEITRLCTGFLLSCKEEGRRQARGKGKGKREREKGKGKGKGKREREKEKGEKKGKRK